MAWTAPEKDKVVSDKGTWTPPQKDTIISDIEPKANVDIPNINIKSSPKEVIDDSYKWNPEGTKDIEIPHAVQVSGLPQLKDVNLSTKLDIQKQASELRYNDAKNLYLKTDAELNSLKNQVGKSDALLDYYGKDNVNYADELKNNIQLKEKLNPIEQRHKTLTSFVENNRKEVDELGKQLDSLKTPIGESYTGGAIRSGVESTAKLLEDVNGASNAVTDFLGLPHYPVYKNMANSIRNSVSGIPEEPKNTIGNILGGLTGMTPLVAENLLFPEYKYVPSLPQALAFNAFGDAYSKGLSSKETLENVYEATKEGYIMHGLGIGAKGAGKLAEDLSKNKIVGGTTAAIVAGGGFGGADAIKQYVNTGKIDMNKVWESVGTGVAFELPGLVNAMHAKAVDTFIKSSEESINQAANIDKTTEEIRDEAIHSLQSAVDNPNQDVKEQRIIASNLLNAAADNKSIVPAIIHDKDAFINLINDRTDLTIEQKDNVIKKVNAVYEKNHPVLKELEPLRNEFNKVNRQIEENKDRSEIDREILNAPFEKRKKEIMDDVVDFLKNRDLKKKEKGVSPEIVEANQTARAQSFDDATHLLNAVKKYTGNEYEKVQDVPANIINETIEKRNIEKEAKAIKPLKGLDRAGKGFDDLMGSLGLKGDIISEGKRPQVVRALQDIVIGLAEHTGKKGNELLIELKKYLKDKGVTGITEKDVDELSSDILPKEQKELTALKKSKVEEERLARGESPLEKTLKEGHKELIEQAAEIEKKDPEAKNRLTKELIEKPRSLENKEVALLAVKRIDLKNKWEEAYDANQEANKSGDADAIEEAKVRFESVRKELGEFEEAIKKSAARTAKGLKAMDLLINDEYELQNQIQKYKDVNKGEISPEVEAKFKAYDLELQAKNKEIRELQKQIEEEENKKHEETIEYTIQEVVREHRKQERKSSVESIRAERKDILNDISKILKQKRGTLSAGVPIPVEIIPHITKLAKGYIKEGIVNVEQLVDNVYNDLKDHIEGVDKRAVRDAISGYGKDTKPVPREKHIEDANQIRKVAKLMSKLEDLESGKAPAKSARQKTNEIKEIQELKDKIKSFEKSFVLKGKIYKSELEKNIIKEKFDIEQEKAKQENRPLSQKITDTFVDVINIPKSLVASADMSAPLRQGAILSSAHPILASKASVEMFKQAFSESKSAEWLHELKASPEYKVMKQSGLYLSEPTTKLKAKEESFISNIASKIPIWGHVVKGSERAYSGYLNKLRVDVFSQFHDNLVESGIKGKELDNELKSFAKFINNATGRGDLGKYVEPAAPLLNSVFFSPRFVKSRFNLINPVSYVKMTKSARIEALKSIGSFIGMGATVLALSNAAGASVELDPRSSDFGKIRFGKIRFDVWAGMQQVVRLVSELVTNSTKPIGQKVKKLGQGYKADTMVDVAGKFVRGKLSPAAAAAVDYLSSGNKGKFKDITGKESNVAQEAAKLVVPMWSSDLQHIFKKQGIGMGSAAAVSSFFGVGVQDYGNK